MRGLVTRTGASALALWLVVLAAGGQSPALATGVPAKPLPDVATLMKQVEANQKTSEALVRNYTYTSTVTQVLLNGHGDVKKTETEEREVFYIGDARLERLTKKDGKPLDGDEQRKESERIDKAFAKAKKRGDEPREKDTVTFARFLELGSFGNERRVMLRGRSTIALDYAGDPKAKTKNAVEGVIHELAGTVWVDEESAALSRVEGHFLNNFKVGGGLVFNVAKDTSFKADWVRVNGEVWLPSDFAASGSMRALLFFNFNGRVSGTAGNYRRFKTNSTILPGMQEVGPDAPPGEGGPAPAPQKPE